MAVHAQSAIGFMRPTTPVFPLPYAPTQQDLQQVAYSYAGFAVGAAITGRISRVLTLFATPSVLTLHPKEGTLTLFPSPSVLTAGDE